MIAGDTTGMEVIHFDTIFYGGPWNSSVSHNIELFNGPPTVRLYFGFQSAGAVGTGQSQRIGISSSPGDIWFNGYFQNDTIRVATDSLVQYDGSWTFPYHINVTYTWGCGLDPSEPVDTIFADQFHPFLYSNGQSIDTTAYQDVGGFSDSFRSNWTTMGSPLNDSTFYQGEFDYLNNCFDLNTVDPFYVAFRMNVNGTVRKGWVKLQPITVWGVGVDHVALEP